MKKESKPIFEVKTDCLAYNKDFNDCIVLTDLYCKKENCSFYKTKEQYLKDAGDFEGLII